MQEYYSLLGVPPTATTDEIEEAYQNKRREFSPEHFEQGTGDWLRAFAMMKKLDNAYDQVIAASFAPIRALQHTPSAPSESLREAPPAQSSYRPVSEPSVTDSALRGLVEEIPVSLSDAQLLSMDAQGLKEMRESYAPRKKESAFSTWGIEDRLLRYYAKTYVAYVVFDLLMRASLGMMWVGMSGVFNHYSVLLKEMAPPGASLAETLSMMPSPPLFMSIIASFVSTAYLFLCSLPMPIVTRFFILGQPAEKGAVRWMVVFLSIAAALVLYSLTGFLFRLLPADWAGSGVGLIFVAPALCLATVRYEGD
ncbi:MAG: J domain-containing protein [Synergistaceae bacterium]|jgi:hypothetical protein|nr:J domain-containing protein [Synergistaceae bacterium]